MSIRDCYVFLDADYENTRKYMDSDEELLQKLRDFVQDRTFYSLVLRLGERNYEVACTYAASLRDKCGSMGFTALYRACDKLCGALESGHQHSEVPYLLQTVMIEYERTVAAVKTVVPA